MARNIRGLRRGGPGRPKGSENKRTVEGREFARLIITDEKYRKNLLKRAQTGKLHPSVENALWDRVHGKVKDTLKHEGLTPAALTVTVLRSKKDMEAILGVPDPEAGTDEDDAPE